MIITNNIYIILNGEVIINSDKSFIKKLHNGEIFNKELIDGDEGELNLITRIDTNLLVISKEAFDEIIYKEEKNKFYNKLYAIKSCSLFSKVPIADLFVFTLKLKSVAKKFGDVLIKRGTVQNKCYVIASGACKSYIEFHKELNNINKTFMLKYFTFKSNSNKYKDKCRRKKGSQVQVNHYMRHSRFK